ncbi:MAG: hypothetical protein JXR46_16865 [Calditrichaceae bacterium]|nr:hypothetical protein [Calditrichaceae bacterium]MBN2710720.1 hypothetical protein [Calditrichaceae bacterium]RQV92749.1 MAG: hypothetical protein EH224_14550 [Calditrichota bacterium]
MNEIKLKYQKNSPEKLLKTDRIQILTAAFALLIGYIDTFHAYIGALMIIPIIGITIAILNFILVIRLKYFYKKFGEKLSLFMFRSNGLMLLITALGYQFIGRHAVQYVLYVLSLIYLFVLPVISGKVKRKYQIAFGNGQITIMRPGRNPLHHNIKNLDDIIIQGDKLTITENNKENHYFLIAENHKLIDDVTQLISSMKKKKQDK